MARLSNETAQKSVAELEQTLRSAIASGTYAAGQLLPSARVLAERHGIGRRLVQAAVSVLEKESVIVAEPRRGYRVLAGAGERGVRAALAFVVPRSEGGMVAVHHGRLFDQLQRTAGAGGRPLLAVGGRGVAPEEVVSHLRSHRVAGVAVNSYEPALLAAMSGLGIPIVAVDVWHPDMAADTVIQDGFLGGYLAAQYLADRGHRRIAYVGRRVPRATGLLAADRFGGAAGGLVDNGLELEASMRLLGEDPRPGSLAERVEALLRDRSRPTAVIALWSQFAVMVAEAADRAGLNLGRDLEIVGWGIAEDQAEGTGASFPQGYRPPTVSWSIRQMAETAIARIEARRAAPDLPHAVLKVPVRLLAPEGGGA